MPLRTPGNGPRAIPGAPPCLCPAFAAASLPLGASDFSCHQNVTLASSSGMVISVHVPKSAGTSFRRVLDEVCGARIWDNYGTIFSRDQARAELVPPGARIIHGHFIADAFDDLFPRRRLVTWVRHPVERLVSNYHHFLRSPDMRDGCCRLLHEYKVSLRQFA